MQYGQDMDKMNGLEKNPAENPLNPVRKGLNHETQLESVLHRAAQFSCDLTITSVCDSFHEFDQFLPFL
jgi:hypothetical protein